MRKNNIILQGKYKTKTFWLGWICNRHNFFVENISAHLLDENNAIQYKKSRSCLFISSCRKIKLIKYVSRINIIFLLSILRRIYIRRNSLSKIVNFPITEKMLSGRSQVHVRSLVPAGKWFSKNNTFKSLSSIFVLCSRLVWISSFSSSETTTATTQSALKKTRQRKLK